MPRVTFQNNEFDTPHEAACAALFIRYGPRASNCRKGGSKDREGRRLDSEGSLQSEGRP